MKFYDFVNEGLVPVLTEIGMSGYINIRVNKQQICIKPSVHHGCVHTHTLTVELLCAIRRETPMLCKGAKSGGDWF